jgi:hypothetical protein
MLGRVDAQNRAVRRILMSYSPLPIVPVSLDDLRLDLDNYRIPTHRDDEAAALNYLFASEDVLGSARQILRSGYFDNEVPIVTKNSDSTYIVLEGNRRVSALKALNDPTVVPDHEPEVRALLKRYAVESENLPTEIRVIVAKDRESAGPHIARLHSGSSKRPWSRDQQSTYYYSLLNAHTTVADIKARYPDEAVVRYIKMAVMRRYLAGVRFSDRSLHEYVTGPDLTMSAFEYAFRQKDIAEAIGVIFEKDGLLKPRADTPESVGAKLDEHQRRAVEYLMNKFRAEGLNTRSPALKKGTKENLKLLAGLSGSAPRPPDDYADADLEEGTNVGKGQTSGTDPSIDTGTGAHGDADAHGDSDARADLDARAGTGSGSDAGAANGHGYEDAEEPPAERNSVSSEEPEAPSDSGSQGADSASRGPNHPDTKAYLQMNGVDYWTHTSVNLQRRYQELRRLNIATFPSATAMLLRSILETSIKFHFEGTPTPAVGELAPSVKVLDEAYGSSKPIRQQIGQIRSGTATVRGSVQWFNLVTHSADEVVKPEDVRQAWELLNPILRRLLLPATDTTS